MGQRPVTPSPTPIAIGRGEPWVLYGRHLDNRQKALFLVRPDGSDDHRILTELDASVMAFDWSPDWERCRAERRHPDGRACERLTRVVHS